jgi:ABC-type phosphate transport system substrate-binding protein
MRPWFAIVILLAFSRVGASADAPLYVIVNAKNPATKVDREVISDLFLKKRTRWSDDLSAQPVDLVQKSDTRAKFSRIVLGRDVASVRRYWAKLVFSGRGVPPPELPTDADVIKYVAEHAGGVGYVSSASTVVGVKVVEVK